MSTQSPPTSSSRDDTPFDFVIVGSGAGGAPLASRLAEYGYSVLVLEAGPDHSQEHAEACEIIEVPGLHAASTENPKISWEYFVEHYENPTERDPKRNDAKGGIFYPRATGVGGCTIHNAMITIVGPASDWNNLAAFLNDPSWDADVMRGYFQKLECCEYHVRRDRPRTFWNRWADTFWWLLGRDDDPTQGRHGFDGWLHTSTVDIRLGLNDKLLLKMLKAAVKVSVREGLDVPWLLLRRVLHGQVWSELDANHFRRQNERPEGVVLIPVAIYGQNTKNPADRGHRSSPARRLKSVAAAKDSNVTIATNCLAARVVLEPDGGRFRAIGVEYLHGSNLYQGSPNPSLATGDRKTIHARREVILCGGAFNTPQLLMLSGIGPPAHLQERGIECLVPSPGVGQNLQDRYEVTVISKMKAKFGLLEGATFATPQNGAPADPILKTWRESGSGLYGSNGAVLGIFKRSRPELDQPDLFMFGVPLKFKGYETGYSRVCTDEFDLFTWAILKGHTHNTAGVVQLQDDDPLKVPTINFNYFNPLGSNPQGADEDLEALLEGVKSVRRIAKRAGGKILSEYHPGIDHPESDLNAATDDEVRRFIRREAWGHHACGSCRMGRRTDPMAVTDSQFRVLGDATATSSGNRRRGRIEGLRIVDASIFPKIPGYFIVSNIYMASEKAADVIHASALAPDRKVERRTSPLPASV
jgi:choline dehydrogenase